MSVFYKISQLILTSGGSRSGACSDVFVAQPDADKEALGGKLFALVEIDSKSADEARLVGLILERLEHNYYQNEKLVLRERVKTIKIEQVFESCLAKTNKEIADWLAAEKIELKAETFNATAGVIFENNLYFSSLGKNKAFLVYKEKKSEPKPRPGASVRPAEAGVESYKLIDILNKTKANDVKNELNPTKLFSNIVSGVLPKGGYFLLTNEALPEYLSHKQLADIVTTLPPAGAVEQMKNVLSRINAYVSFLGIIIKNTAGFAEEEIKKIPARPQNAKESVINLNAVEDSTEKFLTPGGYVSLKKWKELILPKFRFGGPKALDLKQPNLFPTGLIKDKIFFKRRVSFFSPAKLAALLQAAAGRLAGLLIAIFGLIRRFKPLSFFKNLPARIIDTVLALGLWLKSLSLKSRILMAVFILSAASLSYGLATRHDANQKKSEQALYDNLVKTIEQKENQLDANLLYKNDEAAKKLYDEIRAMVERLDPADAEKTQAKADFLKKYETQMEKIRRVVRVSPLNEIAAYAKLEPAAEPANIIIAGNQIYAGDSANKKIYSLDTANNLATVLNASSSAAIASLSYPAHNDDAGTVYYLNGGQILSLDKAGNMSEADFVKEVEVENIAGLVFYNSRFYLADRLSSQIFRYRKDRDKLTDGSAWLNQKYDFSNTAALGIDGSIYILNKDGRLDKFLKGARENFQLEAIDPALSSADDLSVSRDLDAIYVLDSANRRLALFDKQGAFQCQYRFDSLPNVKNFIVNEKKKTVYLLNGSSLYSGELPKCE